MLGFRRRPDADLVAVRVDEREDAHAVVRVQRPLDPTGSRGATLPFGMQIVGVLDVDEAEARAGAHRRSARRSEARRLRARGSGSPTRPEEHRGSRIRDPGRSPGSSKRRGSSEPVPHGCPRGDSSGALRQPGCGGSAAGNTVCRARTTTAVPTSAQSCTRSPGKGRERGCRPWTGRRGRCVPSWWPSTVPSRVRACFEPDRPRLPGGRFSVSTSG